MKSYGIEYRNKIQRQNKPDGKLFLVDRLFLCPGALPMLDTIRSQRVLTPPGHPFFRSLLTSGFYRLNKSRPIRLGAVLCPCSLRKHGTNGINTCRMTETSVCMVTAITTGARQDIVQKSNNDGGDSKRSVIEYWMDRAKTYSNAEAPHYVY